LNVLPLERLGQGRRRHAVTRQLIALQEVTWRWDTVPIGGPPGILLCACLQEVTSRWQTVPGRRVIPRGPAIPSRHREPGSCQERALQGLTGPEPVDRLVVVGGERHQLRLALETPLHTAPEVLPGSRVLVLRRRAVILAINRIGEWRHESRAVDFAGQVHPPLRLAAVEEPEVGAFLGSSLFHLRDDGKRHRENVRPAVRVTSADRLVEFLLRDAGLPGSVGDDLDRREQRRGIHGVGVLGVGQ
jgi:hypothetical protein